MIRRDGKYSDGSPAWILISQIDHARLAGRLAESWSGVSDAQIAPREEILWAVGHHDDGWRTWDSSPDVNERGQPRSFLEMEIDVAVDIWTQSIDLAEQQGPLQAFAVAGHFTALAARNTANPNDPRFAAAHAFIERSEARMTDWLAARQVTHFGEDSVATDRHAVKWVQFFDRFSLWLCTAERRENDEIPDPKGAPVSLRPRDASQIAIAPWPFREDRLTLKIPGRRVPQRRYTGREDLAAAPSESIQLDFELLPG